MTAFKTSLSVTCSEANELGSGVEALSDAGGGCLDIIIIIIIIIYV